MFATESPANNQRRPEQVAKLLKETMKEKVTSYRLAQQTLNQIDQLSQHTGHSKANVIQTAIDRMYQEETKTMNSKLVRLSAMNQTVYDAINEAIKDGDLPTDATLGPRESTRQGWFPKPDQEILGTVKVRPYESYYIVRRPTIEIDAE